MNSLTGRSALVTAATRGIGKACALRLAGEGATVYIGAITDEEGQMVVDEIVANGGQAKSLYFDARKPDTYSKIVKEAAIATGKLDILVNNYGGTDPKIDLDVENGDSAAFFNMMEDNIRSVYLPVQAAIPLMHSGASIINISSIGSLHPDITRTAYGTAKAAINFLTQEIAVQYARRGIRCNAVLPGITATEALLKNMSEEFRNKFLQLVPLNRMGKPEDIANAVAFLASDEASYITGEIIRVAGGYGIPSPMYATQIKQ